MTSVSCCEKRSTPRRVIGLILVSLSFGTLGAVFALSAANLDGLAKKNNSTLGMVSLIFPSRGTGALLGSLCSRYWCGNRFRPLQMGLMLVLAGISTGAIPWSSNIFVQPALHLAQGVGIGFSKATGGSMIRSIFGFLNAVNIGLLFTAFNTGSFISTMVTLSVTGGESGGTTNRSNLISRTLSELQTELHSNQSQLNDTHPSNVLDSVLAEGVTELQILYLLFMTFPVIAGCVVCVFSFLFNQEDQQHEQLDNGEANPSNFVTCGFICFLYLSVIFVIFVVFLGADVSYADFVVSILTEGGRWTKRNGLLLLMIFWAIYSISSFASTILLLFVTPVTLLIASFIIMCLGAIFLTVISVPAVLWVGSILFAIGVGPLYPSVVLWADYYTDLDARFTAFLIGCTTCGEILIPLMSGLSFHINPMIVVYVLIAGIVMLSVMYTVVEILGYIYAPSLTSQGWQRLGLKPKP